MKSLKFDRSKLAAVCEPYGVKTLSVFGSFARGESTPDSDIDLLASFSRRVSLLRLVALERELSSVLGRDVDLVTEAALSPYIRDRILTERQVVYAA